MAVAVVKFNRDGLPSYRIGLAITIDKVGEGWEPHELKVRGILREAVVEIPANEISNFEHLGNALGASLVLSLQSALGEELKRIAPPKSTIEVPKLEVVS
jgi:hypothetical protein